MNDLRTWIAAYVPGGDVDEITEAEVAAAVAPHLEGAADAAREVLHGASVATEGARKKIIIITEPPP